MATVSSEGKIAYVYHKNSDTWHPVAGSTNTSANFAWTGTHDFSNEVTFINSVSISGDVLATAGINSFINYAARDSVFGATPTVDGAVAFVKNDSSGTAVNDLSYSSGGVWYRLSSQAIDSKTTAYTIELKDSSRMLSINSSTDISITVPTHATSAFPVGSKIEIIRVGTGEVTVVPASGVTIRSKNNNLKLSTQYVGAMLVKLATNEWMLIGDLKA
jgi:hypothetical protein